MTLDISRVDDISLILTCRADADADACAVWFFM